MEVFPFPDFIPLVQKKFKTKRKGMIEIKGLDAPLGDIYLAWGDTFWTSYFKIRNLRVGCITLCQKIRRQFWNLHQTSSTLLCLIKVKCINVWVYTCTYKQNKDLLLSCEISLTPPPPMSSFNATTRFQ